MDIGAVSPDAVNGINGTTYPPGLISGMCLVIEKPYKVDQNWQLINKTCTYRRLAQRKHETGQIIWYNSSHFQGQIQIKIRNIAFVHSELHFKRNAEVIVYVTQTFAICVLCQ